MTHPNGTERPIVSVMQAVHDLIEDGYADTPRRLAIEHLLDALADLINGHIGRLDQSELVAFLKHSNEQIGRG